MFSNPTHGFEEISISSYKANKFCVVYGNRNLKKSKQVNRIKRVIGAFGKRIGIENLKLVELPTLYMSFLIYLVKALILMPEQRTDNFIQGLKLLASDAYFRSLAETIPHILIVVDAETYCMQYVNHLQQGYTLENVIGREVFDFVWPEYHSLYKEKLQELKLTHKTVTLELEGASAMHENGRAWYRTHLSVLPAINNEVTSLMLLSEDITESKLKELESFNRGEKLKAIINNTKDVICSIDMEYNFMEFNTVLFDMVKAGYNVELKPGLSIFKFVDPAKHTHLRSIYKRVENGEAFHDVETFETTTGHVVHKETNYHPILGINKEVTGISIFSKDITERTKGEQSMKSALKEKEALLSEIHHRIKNNLAMVSSLLQLQEMNINSPEAKEALRLSRKRIKSTALIHELLYKNDSFQNISLNLYLNELYKHLRINDNIQLVVLGDEVTLDLSKAMPLGLMLNEIMLNSFKHSYKNASEGRTEITTRIIPNTLVIDYCDCKGNFPDSVDFKNSNTTGLTLIHTFAEQLKGCIELVSKTPPKYKIQIPLGE